MLDIAVLIVNNSFSHESGYPFFIAICCHVSNVADLVLEVPSEENWILSDESVLHFTLIDKRDIVVLFFRKIWLAIIPFFSVLEFDDSGEAIDKIVDIRIHFDALVVLSRLELVQFFLVSGVVNENIDINKIGPITLHL